MRGEEGRGGERKGRGRGKGGDRRGQEGTGGSSQTDVQISGYPQSETLARSGAIVFFILEKGSARRAQPSRMRRVAGVARACAAGGSVGVTTAGHAINGRAAAACLAHLCGGSALLLEMQPRLPVYCLGGLELAAEREQLARLGQQPARVPAVSALDVLGDGLRDERGDLRRRRAVEADRARGVEDGLLEQAEV